MSPTEVPEPILSDYERERGKPLPSFNHSYVQANIATELGNCLRPQYRVAMEVNLELLGES